MAIVAIKVGENESGTYDKFDQISYHLDVVDIVRDKTRSSIGVMADRAYLILNVSMTPVQEKNMGHRIKKPGNHTRRLYRLELTGLAAISAATASAIDVQAGYKRAIKPAIYSYAATISIVTGELPSRAEVGDYQSNLLLDGDFDMTPINRFDKIVTYNDFINAAVNKETLQSIAQELAIG